MSQKQGKTLSILWVFFILSRIFPTTTSPNHTMAGSNPPTRWFHHTVGFSFFFTTTLFKEFVYGHSSHYWKRPQVSLTRGFFFISPRTSPTSTDRQGGVSFQRTPPWAKSLILTLPGLRVSTQRHTYGSESVPIVQGLVYDLNVYS